MSNNRKWTAENIPDLFGKTIIVTGANSGIGYEATVEFARKGAHVVMACRNIEKANAALSMLKTDLPDADAVVMQLDLASQKSVHAFAEVFKAQYEMLDVLVNNAGIMMVPYGTTEDGFERQFGTNHLGHFAMTGLLIDPLLNTPHSRVINISSIGHRQGKMNFDNLMYENGEGYAPIASYARSKLANLLFTYEMQRRLDAAGSTTIATAAHPGGSATNLGNHLKTSGSRLGMRLIMIVGDSLAQSAAMGALPMLRAAVDPAVQGSDYYGPSGFQEIRGYPVKVKSNDASHNADDQRQLWEWSETLTGISYL